MVRKKLRRKRVFGERLRDEESLYYILERDIDREAIFRSHDGWYSQVSFGKGKRIDYIVKYGNRIYGIEVKKDFPTDNHFEQAEKYHPFLDGVFLAYPADGVGQAIYVSELKETKFPDIGLISLTLFRSHIIRKAKQYRRQSEQIWTDQLLDDNTYLKHTLGWKMEQLDRLSETALKDGCFWVYFNRNYKESKRPTKLSLLETDWRGLGLLYGASFSTSLHRFFSIDNLSEEYGNKMGWKGYNLGKLEMCGLATSRNYGDLMGMWALSDTSVFFASKIRKALKEHLGPEEWEKLEGNVIQWKSRHKENQDKYEKEFIEPE